MPGTREHDSRIGAPGNGRANCWGAGHAEPFRWSLHRLIRAWVRPDGLGRPAGPPRGPGGGRVSEPELSPSLVMLATETGVAWELPYKLEPACDTRVAGRGRDLDGMAGRIRCAAHQVRKSPRMIKLSNDWCLCQATVRRARDSRARSTVSGAWSLTGNHSAAVPTVTFLNWDRQRVGMKQ